MDVRQKQEEFSYWKRPRAKWFVLAGGIIEADYADSKIHLCASNGILAILFLGSFLVGNLARSQRSARRAEGRLLLFTALAAGIVLCLSPAEGSAVFWAAVMLACLGGAAYSFWKYRK